MLSSPRSLGFVLAVIIGAMLVPGCRAERRVEARLISAGTAEGTVPGRPEIPPVAPGEAESAHRTRP
jgi:hypothetical protein